MQTAGGGFAGTVSKQDQIVDYKVTITFPSGVQASYSDVTKSVVSVDVQRSASSILPDGTPLIAGYGTATATVTLSGFLNQAAGVALVEAQSIYWLMNPNDTTSPMFRTTRAGLPITIQAGFWDGATTADLVTVFTGTIDVCQCSEGVVTLQCRDQWSTMTNQAKLPPVITGSPYNTGLTGEFAMDSLARHASPQSYYSWPAQRANCVLAVGFRSSLWPDVGTVTPYGQTPIFDQGINGTEFGSSLLNFPPVYTLAKVMQPADHFCGQFFSTAANPYVKVYQANTVNTDSLLIWRYITGDIFIYSISPSGAISSASITTVAGNALIEWSLSWPTGSATVSGTVWVNGASHAVSFSASDARAANGIFDTAVIQGPIEGVQITTESSYTPLGSFTPTLVFDPAGSLNPLTALPDTSLQSTTDALQSIAAAEAGAIFFDEVGKLRFLNRQTIGADNPVRTITSSTSLKTLDSLEQMSLCATHITLPVNQIAIGPPAIIWSATSVVMVQPGTPVVLVVNTNDPVVSVPTTDSGFYYATTAVLGRTYYQACSTPDGVTGFAVGSGVSIKTQQLSSTQLVLTIANTNMFNVYLVTPNTFPGPGAPANGSPAIFIGGQAITSTSVAVSASNTTGSITADAQWPPLVGGVGGAVTNTMFGEVLLAISQNDWVQQGNAAYTLVNDLLSDLHYPIPLLRNMDIVADPRLQLFDVVTVADPDVSQINDQALIIGIDTTFSVNDWSQTIDARPLWPPGAWELGVAGHSELGTTTYLY